MSGCGCLEVREFAFNPDIDESPLQYLPDFEAQLRNRIDLALEFRVSHSGSIVYPLYGSIAALAARRGGNGLGGIGNCKASRIASACRIPRVPIDGRRTNPQNIRRAQ